jgi:malonyl CoA-acyl carrier protein transacylase
MFSMQHGMLFLHLLGGASWLGASIFVEAGPGTTLAGLIKRTVPGAAIVSIENQATLELALPGLRAAAAGSPGRVKSRA